MAPPQGRLAPALGKKGDVSQCECAPPPLLLLSCVCSTAPWLYQE